jgi:hypothetical protein
VDGRALVVGQRGERDVDVRELGVGDRLDALEHLVGELDACHPSRWRARRSTWPRRW